MITAEKLSYGIVHKDLFKKVSFEVNAGEHCALIGSNGTGKSTLLNMIKKPDDFLFDGKLKIESGIELGYVSQFYEHEQTMDQTVYEYISKPFVDLESEIARLCDEMAVAEDMTAAFEAYQQTYDIFTAMDGDHYESNILKQLKTAELLHLKDIAIGQISGGEYKLVQIVKELMTRPGLVLMDEPDVFLDFAHLTALVDLINGYKGTLIVVTHNRYLLNHCFNKIIHLENGELQMFEGNYEQYKYLMLQTKIEKQEMAAVDQEEIQRNKTVVERMRKKATELSCSSLGRALHARVSLLERLEARQTKDPFIDHKEPEIAFKLPPAIENSDVEETIASVTEARDVLVLNKYDLAFEQELLKEVSFSLKEGEKIAIVGENGTGKTSMLREIAHQANASIHIPEDIKVAYLSQIHGEMFDDQKQVIDIIEDAGDFTPAQAKAYLEKFEFPEDMIYARVSQLSGGEKNMLQIAKITLEPADLLLLDEPTSHLDTYAQIALEKAIKEYKGSVLMISHDFYTITECADAVLLVENKNLRRISIRKFRKMIYADHFSKDYLEKELEKKNKELKIMDLLKNHKFEEAKMLL